MQSIKKLNVLFLCTGNSCRSQMAEGWLRNLHSDTMHAFSAGIETHGLNPNAIKVMAEVGIDISQHQSQHIDGFRDTHLDVVITVCDHAHETCPWFPTEAKVIHHSFPDPPKMARELSASGASEEEQLDCYRQVRDEIKTYISNLPEELKGSIHE